MTIKPFKTFIQAHPGAQRRDERPSTGHLTVILNDPVYAEPVDVPIALRQALRRAYDSGITIEQLNIIYEIPIDWITMFVKPQ